MKYRDLNLQRGVKHASKQKFYDYKFRAKRLSAGGFKQYGFIDVLNRKMNYTVLQRWGILSTKARPLSGSPDR